MSMMLFQSRINGYLLVWSTLLLPIENMILLNHIWMNRCIYRCLFYIVYQLSWSDLFKLICWYLVLNMRINFAALIQILVINFCFLTSHAMKIALLWQLILIFLDLRRRIYLLMRCYGSLIWTLSILILNLLHN